MKINKSNLKKIREEKSLTQVEIAIQANITERSYQRYETSKRVPNVYTAQLIAQALNTTVEEIFPLPQRQLREIEIEKEPDGNPAEKNI